MGVFIMDLLEQLKLEINKKGIMNDKFAIARYIYIRTGQLFDYNPLYSLFPGRIKEDFNREIKDIRNIKDFNVICFSWADLYVKLLNAFGIEARVIKNDEHAKVYLVVDGFEIIADLTLNYLDIYLTKFGFETARYTSNNPGFQKKLEATNKKINYQSLISPQEVLEMLKADFRRDAKNDTELMKLSFLACKAYLSFHKCGNISANKFIIAAMNKLTNGFFQIRGGTTYLYDFNTNSRTDIFYVEDICYAYGIKDGHYSFYEISLEEIKELYESMNVLSKETIRVLLKKQY